MPFLANQLLVRLTLHTHSKQCFFFPLFQAAQNAIFNIDEILYFIQKCEYSSKKEQHHP
jgi:hypothetical protein